ncbi:MAG TPA: response regulator [bacterium]|nr:response regulator [bacterium]HPO07794.1 response regulator [bacterium]HQO34346.1 response regulator [bacterium]HQP97897.1 response regulator [bacterium]
MCAAKRVLICEDDADARLLIRSILRTNHFDVAGEAETGIQALNLFKETKPDIVLLDIQMPQGGGLTVLRFLREIDQKVRVILLTVDDSPHSVRTALKLGANDYVIKSSLTTPRFLQALQMEGVLQPEESAGGESSNPDEAPEEEAKSKAPKGPQRRMATTERRGDRRSGRR